MSFHEGELAVQQRAGVRDQAARLSGMLDPADLRGGAARFLAERSLAVLSGRDARGCLWISPLIAAPGFLQADEAGLHVDTVPRPGDPLVGLTARQPVGLIAIELATRRRFRVNGQLVRADERALDIAVEEAFGNCPQYIQPRRIDVRAAPVEPRPSAGETSELTPAVAEVVRSAETFFLATTHPTRGADASHRGGPAGFVRIDGNELWWPDYPGNNMFNSFGNLAIDDEAALLFIDFATGATVHLSGTAQLEWTTPGVPGDDGGTGRRVRFTAHRIVHNRTPLPIEAGPSTPYPRNPGLTD